MEANDFEKMLRELLASLRRMEERQQAETARPTERPTTALEKPDWVQWVMLPVLRDLRKEIDSACEKRNAATCEKLTRKIEALESVLSGVTQVTDATKTTTGRVIENVEFLETVRKQGLLLFLNEWAQEDGYHDRLDYCWNWVIDEEERRETAKTTSRYTTGVVLQVLGMVLAFGVGFTGLLLSILRG